MSDVTRPDRDFDKLHPELRRRLLDFLQLCGRRKLAVFVTEGWRSPERQAWLYESGRTREGPILTHAKPGQSYHNITILGRPYSGAVDVAVWDEDEPWSKSLEWTGTEEEWEILHDCAHKAGLETLEFEAPHLQLPYSRDVISQALPWPEPWEHPLLDDQEAAR
jgi:peptidoglycan L-alanyl-D-glutamate endopeptidase CwlK